MKILLTTLLLLTFNISYASGDFKCVVKEAYILDSNGKLNAKANSAKSKINKEFTVNRQTGQMSGGGFINTMSGQMPTVFNYLPNENGFKAITIYKPNFTVDYLQINEYEEGKNKPFFYKGAWGIIATGICNYY